MSLQVRPDRSPRVPQDATPLGWPIGGGLLLVLVVTLVVGLQLGALPWRFRKQMWQLQGALAGGAVGMVVGVAIGRRRQP
ncbi:MAG: hypothetical protein KME02_16235 [Aphanothece saxicola GSE-SYN-MK-01-06B]|jgi:hypothetical protein|nr:hypothetical protein [Aphanothece saxicola GSE-SYN-MK-01-06B]